MCPLGPQGHGEGKKNLSRGYTEPPARTPSYEKYLDEPDSLDDWLEWRAGLDPNYNLGYTFLELLKRTPAGVPRYLALDELTDTAGAGIPDVIVDFFGVDTSDPLFADSDTGGTGYSLTERYWAGEDLGNPSAAALSWVNDGVPNVWKLRYGLDPLDPAVSFADPDEDGQENFVEYLLGRDPLVAELGGPGKGTAPVATNTLRKAAAKATADEKESKGASSKKVALRSAPVANTLTPPPDTDGDGLDDTLDAAPNDPVVNWLRAPESRYLVIPLGGAWSPKFINDNSEVLGEFQDEDPCSCDPVDRQFAVWKGGTWTELNTAVALLDKKPGAPSQTQTRKVQVVTGIDNAGAIYGEVTSQGQPDCGVYPEYGPGTVRWTSSTATPQLIISQKLYETTSAGSLEKTHLARYLPGGLSWSLKESDFIPSFTPSHLVATLESELQINGQVFDYSLETTYVLGSCSVPEVNNQIESGTRYEVRGTTRSGFGILKDLNNFQAGSGFQLINPAGALETLTGSFAHNSVKIIESPPPTGTVGRPILVIPSGPYTTSSHIKSLYGWEATQTSIPGGKMNSQGIAIGNGSSSIWRNGQILSMVSLVDEKEADGVTPVWSGFGLIDINSSGVIAAVGFRGEEGEFEPVLLVPFEILGHKRGTINAPGEAVPKGEGPFGQETVMLENANIQDNATQPDYATATVDPDDDDDLVKVVLRWPKNLKLPGAKLELKHMGLAVNPTKTTEAEIYQTSGSSRVNFYTPAGVKLQNTDLKIDDLSSPGNGNLAQILTTGEQVIFIEGGEEFGNLGLTSAKMQLLGGAALDFTFTYGGVESRSRLLVYRGGFLVFKQPTQDPGVEGTFEFWDGKGRIKHKSGGYPNEFQEDVTDWGTQLKSWGAKSGKIGGNVNYQKANGKGHTPPGWWWAVENPLALNEQQTHKASGKITNLGQVNEKWKQGAFCRWLQDDAPAGQRYSGNYVYDKTKVQDAQLGAPTFLEYKFRLFAILPTTPYSRTGLLIHPDGEKDGTLGCIGIQSWTDVNEVAETLTNYHGLKVKVQNN